MKNFGSWMSGSGILDKQDEIKFDASQYEFFGNNVEEHDLGEFNEGMVDYSVPFEATEDEDLPILRIVKGKDVTSSAFIDDLANNFNQMNRISESRSSRNITDRVHSSTPGFERYPNAMPHRRWTGTVKWYSNQRGYGFVTTIDGEDDVFVHSSSLKTDGYIHLSPGTQVEFEVVSGLDHKIQAINVTGPGGKLLKDSRRVEHGEDLSSNASSTGSSSSSRNIGSQNLTLSNLGISNDVVGPCFNCGQLGHLAKNCDQLVARDSQWPAGYAWCCICGKLGHVANFCPYNRLYK